MKRICKRVLSVMLCVTLVTALLPQMNDMKVVKAEESGVICGAFTVTGGEENTDYTYSDGLLTINTGTPITIKNTNPDEPTTDCIEVAYGVKADITLAGVNIDVSSTGSSNKLGNAAFKIADNSTGNVTITLADGTNNILVSGWGCAGLEKNGEAASIGRLEITRATGTTGTLTAKGGYCGAGIGGGNNGSVSDIWIVGAEVTATGGYSGAGIGGGSNGSVSTINIDHAEVEATGGYNGAGIGGGYKGSVSTININYAEVKAKGGDYGAGIGGGNSGSVSGIGIIGAEVTATGGDYGAGIGGGNMNGSGETIYIETSEVTATGGASGAGIGSGYRGETIGDMQMYNCKLVAATGGERSAGIIGYIKIYNSYVIVKKGLNADDEISGTSGITDSLVIIGTDGTVKGEPKLNGNITIATDVELKIGSACSLTVEKNATFINKGTITISEGGTIYNKGIISNGGNITISEGGTIDNYGIISNDRNITNNNGRIINRDSGIIENQGELAGTPILGTNKETTEHNYVWTSIENDSHTGICTYNSSHVVTEEHSFGEWSKRTVATCTEDGEKVRICTVCEYKDEGIIEATGHFFTDYVSDNNATCTEDGTKTATCDNGCGETDTIEDSNTKTGHTEDRGTVTKAPTETETGIKTYKCTVCGDVLRTEEIEKLEAEEPTPEQPTPEQPAPGQPAPEQPTPGQPAPEQPAVGETVPDTASNATYTVTTTASADGKTAGEVQYNGPADKTQKKIIIPDTVKTSNGVEYKVTSIVDNAFSSNKTITEVKVGANITTIGKNAFKNCTKLKKVTLGANITIIGNNAFSGCKELTTVKVGKKIQTIGNSAFEKCTSLKSITLPASVKKIGKKAFFGDKALKKITINTTKLTNKSVGAKAFKGINSNATIKVPKRKLAEYKQLLKKKGVGSKAKIKK